MPDSLREAALALGTPRWRVVLRIVLPTAARGLVTGALLSVARAAGETAPLLFTASLVNGTNFALGKPTNSLPLQIFSDVQQAQDRFQERAWGAALTLVALILLLTLLARLLASRRTVDPRPSHHAHDRAVQRADQHRSLEPARGRHRPAPRRWTVDPRRPPRATGSRCAA